MPYNSSSFERQLAKYKQAEAEKAVAEMPRKKYEVYEDPHQVKSKIPAADRGHIKSYALDPVQIMGEGGQTAPLAKPDIIINPVIIKSKKPFYQRTWFVLFVITTLPTLFMPVMFKDQWNEVKGVASSIQTSTGVDPFSLSTYVNMFKGRHDASPSEDNPATAILGTQPAVQPAAPIQIDKDDMAAPMDMHDAVQKAQEKTDSITAKGPDYSMKYIQSETERLNNMAKQFDDQHKK